MYDQYVFKLTFTEWLFSFQTDCWCKWLWKPCWSYAELFETWETSPWPVENSTNQTDRNTCTFGGRMKSHVSIRGETQSLFAHLGVSLSWYRFQLINNQIIMVILFNYKHLLYYTSEFIVSLFLYLTLMTHSIISPIDGKSMESITCIKAHQRLEYRASGKVIRWTEVKTATNCYHWDIYFIYSHCFLVWWIDHFFDSAGVLPSEGGAI